MLLYKKQTIFNSNLLTQKNNPGQNYLFPPSQPPSSFYMYVTNKTNEYNLLYKYEAAGIQVTEHSEDISSIKSTLDNCKNKVSLF